VCRQGRAAGDRRRFQKIAAAGGSSTFFPLHEYVPPVNKFEYWVMVIVGHGAARDNRKVASCGRGTTKRPLQTQGPRTKRRTSGRLMASMFYGVDAAGLTFSVFVKRNS